MQAWKTLSKKLIYKQSPWLNLEAHEIELPDGRRIHDWLWIDTPDFVIVSAIDQLGRFLVFRQTKYAAEGTTLAPVGGYLMENEDPLEAAKRELLEETGYEADEWTALGSFMTDANRGNGRGYYFLARNARPSQQFRQSDDLEEQELHFLTAEELSEALKTNQVQIITWQAGLAMALMHYPDNPQLPG
ncbi:MAG: NUDIX hydrolase [Anaerolineaceae bacterium]|jgi:ADP-ribose pyrophosphatase